MVHGELYDETRGSPAALARLYLERGPGFAKALNGSFALVVMDGQEDRVLVITDRLSSRRLFWSRVDGDYLVSSDVAAQPRDRFPLDQTAIAWCLGAGAAFHRRTLYDGIRMLDRACVHELTDGGVRSEPYWTLALNQQSGAVDEAALEEAMEASLVSAVRRRCADEPDLFLSLSGGYDSTGVAGVLARDLGIERVEAISYAALGQAAPGSDALSASRTAARLGFPHRVVRSYDGDLVEHFARNARLGEGLTNACDEVDAWVSSSNGFGDARHPVLMTGDERLGFSSASLATNEDVLRKFNFGPVQLPHDLASRLPASFVPHLRDGLLGDVQEILARQPPFEDPGDLQMHLMADQREVHLFLAWRERFAGRFATVRTPWLDPDVMDLVNRLPRRLRRGKKLYKRIVDRRFPDLLSEPEPLAAGYEFDLGEELRSHAPRIEDWIKHTSSRLDETAPPEFGLHLLRAELRLRNEHLDRLRRMRSRAAKKLARISGRGTPGTSSGPVRGPTLFRRWAILRMALGADPG